MEVRNKIKEKILSLPLKNYESAVTEEDELKVNITYSYDRAKKDCFNREKGLRKLEKHIRSGRLTKASINNRGYNKFLKLEGEITVSIDTNKLKAESRWDELKGNMLNAKLSKDEIIENDQHFCKSTTSDVFFWFA